MLRLQFLIALVPFQHNKIFIWKRQCIITIHNVQTAFCLKFPYWLFIGAALLNLPPNSTDAQVVEQLAANSGGNNSTAVTGNVSSDPCTQARSAHFLLVFHSTTVEM